MNNASLMVPVNPYTPMAFFPPEIAREMMVSCFIMVAAFAVSSRQECLSVSLKLLCLY